MGLTRNLVSVMILMLIVWGTFLLVSYVVSITIFYTLEYPSDTFLSILRVLIGLATAGVWVIGWYALTRFWLYKLLLE